MPLRVYDRAGRPIGVQRFAELIEDDEYRRVASTRLHTPAGMPVWVSTVWLGVDHNWLGLDQPPLIFETMVFYDEENGPVSWDALITRRHATETQALLVHHEVVAGLERQGLIQEVDA